MADPTQLHLEDVLIPMVMASQSEGADHLVDDQDGDDFGDSVPLMVTGASR